LLPPSVDAAVKKACSDKFSQQSYSGLAVETSDGWVVLAEVAGAGLEGAGVRKNML
jgi:hypothetical protein